MVLKDGLKLSEQDLIQWSKKKLANYKCPKKIVFINKQSMPRNATGKIMHKDLREMLLKKVANE